MTVGTVGHRLPRRGRVRFLGEAQMPLDDTFPGAVAFVVADLRDEETGVISRRPIGTGFVVSMISEALPEIGWYYFVTAAHVVRNEAETWVRLTRKDGGTADHPVAEWFIHPTEDVAVTPFVPPGDVTHKNVQRKTHFNHEALPKWPEIEPNLGDRVYFIGLLAGIAAMENANVPMVRSGTLGRKWQSGIPVEYEGITTPVTGHLIDCRSYGGFSGSPCFIQHEFFRGGNYWIVTSLLGMIVAHFDLYRGAKVTGDFIGEVRTPINSGVGVVLPVQVISEALDMEELVELRKISEERAKEKREETQMAATPDAAPPGEPLTQAEFADALQRVTRKVEPEEEPTDQR